MNYKGIWGVMNAYSHFEQIFWKVFNTLKSDQNDNCIIFYTNVNFYILNEVNNNGSIGFEIYVHFLFIFVRNHIFELKTSSNINVKFFIIQKLILMTLWRYFFFSILKVFFIDKEKLLKK